MDPLTTSVVTTVAKYALDKGAELVTEVGPKALDTAKEMFAHVMKHVRGRPDGEFVAKKFEQSPEVYQEPLKEDFAEQLKALLFRYEEAVKEYKVAMGISYQATLTGSGAIVQGPGAVGAGEGGVAVWRDVHGDVVAQSKTTPFDQRGQIVGQQANIAESAPGERRRERLDLEED